jgi:thioredoxin-like negative regulator of GroEL
VLKRALWILLTAALAWPLVASASTDDVNPVPLYLQAVSLREAGDLEGAATALEGARQLAPSDPDLTLELARTYAADRRYGDAAAAFGEAVWLAPDRADLALAQARFHLDHGFRLSTGLRAAERAAALAPQDPAAIALLDRARTLAALFGTPRADIVDAP